MNIGGNNMIKKMILTIICCWSILTVILAQTRGMYANSTAKVFLQHDGNITGVYGGNSLSTAVTAAVDGDIIYISSGDLYLNTSVTVDKNITFIGAAAEGDNKTRIDSYSSGLLCLNTTQEVVFEGIYFGTSPSFANATNVVFRKCGGSLSLGSSSDVEKQNITLDRCYIENLHLYSSIYKVDAKNCRIKYMQGTGKSTFRFDYCNVYQYSIGACLFTNSILSNCKPSSNSNSYIKVLYAVNSDYAYYRKELVGSCVQDCVTSNSPVLDEYASCLLTTEELKEMLLGYDGKIIGADGGTNPYTLVRNAPVIDESSTSIVIDKERRKIEVEKIKVSANK